MFLFSGGHADLCKQGVFKSSGFSGASLMVESEGHAAQQGQNLKFQGVSWSDHQCHCKCCCNMLQVGCVGGGRADAGIPLSTDSVAQRAFGKEQLCHPRRSVDTRRTFPVLPSSGHKHACSMRCAKP